MAGRGRKKEKIIKVKESSVDDITTNMNKEYFSNYEVLIIIVISVVFGGILGSIITLNRDYRSDVSNSNATNASELKISGTTLVHFKNGKIVEYITGNISEYLNK